VASHGEWTRLRFKKARGGSGCRLLVLHGQQYFRSKRGTALQKLIYPHHPQP
jgi:hypothetical protein